MVRTRVRTRVPRNALVHDHELVSFQTYGVLHCFPERVRTRVHTTVRTRSPGAHSKAMVRTMVHTTLAGFGAHKLVHTGAHKLVHTGAHKGAHKALGVKGIFANNHITDEN